MTKVDMDALRTIVENQNVSKKKAKTFNQRIVDELGTDEMIGKKVERYDLINRIAFARAQDEGLEIDLTNPEFVKAYQKLSITCRNGVDTSVANGHTNSNFSFNEKFKAWKLHKDETSIWLTKA